MTQLSCTKTESDGAKFFSEANDYLQDRVVW